MTVIARHRTQEFNGALTVPGLASADSLAHHTGNGVEHHIEAGVASHKHIFRRYSQHLSEHLAHFRNTLQQTVITAVHPAFAAKIRILI